MTRDWCEPFVAQLEALLGSLTTGLFGVTTVLNALNGDEDPAILAGMLVALTASEDSLRHLRRFVAVVEAAQPPRRPVERHREHAQRAA